MAVIACFMEFFFEKLYGDLTRIGYFTERDFGWYSPQQTIPPEQFKNYSLAEADVLVIGDSFSEKRAWQTRLIADGLKVTTLHWKDLKTAGEWNLLPDNLSVALQTAGFKGRYVIIESIERLFQERVKTLSSEHHPIVKPDIAIYSAPYGKRKRVSLSQPNGANWSINALSNTLRLSLIKPDRYIESQRVQAIKFDGCRLFSNRLCSYALFFHDDFTKKTFSAIDNVLIVNKQLQVAGIQAIWVVIPDKSTVYLGYGKYNKFPYQNIWQQFSEHSELIAPNLDTLFIQKKYTITDFYMPNDGHLSTNAYLYLGDFMTKGLHKLQANQPNPFAQ
jgi:hypothetical protein